MNRYNKLWKILKPSLPFCRLHGNNKGFSFAILKRFNSTFNTESFNHKTKQKSIERLANSNQWREALLIVDAKSMPSILDILAKRAFSEFEMETGWCILKKIAEQQLKPSCALYETYWDFCANSEKPFYESVEDMFKFILSNQLTVPWYALIALDNHLKCWGGGVHKVNINDFGKCERCASNLIEQKLSMLEFRSFKQEFDKQIVDKMLDKKDLFIFKQMVNSKRTFDYVIDVLNVCRIGPANKGNIFKQGNMVVKTIDELRKQSNRIFVVGKQHIKEWPEHSINYINRNSSVFLINNRSKVDDIFLMYATLISGPNSFFVTNDLLDEYKNYFHGKMLDIFKRWQKQQQLTVSYNQQLDKIQFRKLPHINISNKINQCWHIPYYEHESANSSRYSYKWSCIELKKN